MKAQPSLLKQNSKVIGQSHGEVISNQNPKFKSNNPNHLRKMQDFLYMLGEQFAIN